jgi:hypothetical protein
MDQVLPLKSAILHCSMERQTALMFGFYLLSRSGIEASDPRMLQRRLKGYTLDTFVGFSRKSKKCYRGNSVVGKKKNAFSTIHPKVPFVLPALCKILQKGIVKSRLDREIEAVESFHISVALHAHHARHAVVRVCLWVVS